MVRIKKYPFGRLCNGMEAEIYTFSNGRGAEASFTNYGASVVSIMVPDKNGRMDDVVLGYDSVQEYEENDRCAGATCGRVAARLSGGRFVLNDRNYIASQNENGVNMLHGGFEGFNVKLWEARIEKDTVIFSYVSRDGEEGFPGTLLTEVHYSFTDENEVIIYYQASSDKDTVINLTNHIYFNLAGHGRGSIRGHWVQLFSDYYLQCDGTPMPDGQVLTVGGTPMDFRIPVELDRRLDSKFEQISKLGGYNHDYFLNKVERGAFQLGGIIHETSSGRNMSVYTTMPAIHFFTANNLTKRRGKSGSYYDIHDGFCIEPGFPADSMHFLHFPSPVLRAGEVYNQKTCFKFYV